MYASPISDIHVAIIHSVCVFVCLCACDADNGVAVSMNDIIIKLVATTLKVSRFIHTYSM